MSKLTIKDLKTIFNIRCRFVPSMFKSGKDIYIEIRYDEVYDIISKVLFDYKLTLIRKDIKNLPEFYTITKLKE